MKRIRLRTINVSYETDNKRLPRFRPLPFRWESIETVDHFNRRLLSLSFEKASGVCSESFYDLGFGKAVVDT